MNSAKGEGRFATFFFWIVATLMIVTDAYFRMRGVTQNGIRGSDTFQYFEIATLWHQGQFVLNDILTEFYQFFRPLHYALGALGISLFEGRDYSLRMMMGFVETLNTLLVIVLGLMFLRHRLSALLLALVYMASPSVFVMSNSELPHTLSTLFALFFLAVFKLALDAVLKTDKKAWRLIFLSGILAGAAATCHGSLSFLGPAAILIFSILHFWPSRSFRAIFDRDNLRMCVIFTAGFFLNHVLWGFVIGFGKVFDSLFSESHIHGGAGTDALELFRAYLWKGPQESLNPALSWIWLLAVLVFAAPFILRRLRGKPWLSGLDLLPLAVYVFTLFFFTMAFPDVYYSRLFLPFNVFVLLTCFQALEQVLVQPHLRFLSPVLMTGFAVWMAYLSFWPSHLQFQRISEGREKGNVRPVFEQLGTQVNAEQKILIAPYIHYEMRRQFNATPYFGKNAVYLIECTSSGLTLDEFVRNSGIRYIFLSNSSEWDTRILRKKEPQYAQLGACVGMNPETYKVEEDVRKIEAFVQSRGGVRLPLSSDVGTLYFLP